MNWIGIAAVYRSSESKVKSRETHRETARDLQWWTCGRSRGAIGISAGTFLAIATADILPQVHRIQELNPLTWVSLMFGLAVS